MSSRNISELESRLEAVGAGPERARARVDALVELAWAIRFTERERAYCRSMPAPWIDSE